MPHPSHRLARVGFVQIDGSADQRQSTLACHNLPMRRRDFLKLSSMATTIALTRSASATPALNGNRLRGIMIDAARLTERPDYYRRVIDFCHDWKLNTILFRLTDDQGSAFRFESHPELVTHDHALTASQARELAEYGQKRGVQLIPEIESFGHTSYITAVPKYQHLADTPLDKPTEFVGISPVHPDSLALMRDLYREVAKAFPSQGIHHLGVAVDDLDAALATYERLFGAEVEHRATVEEQGVRAASLRIGGDRVELLEPLGEDTPVGRFIAKRGPGMHHVAYEVADLDATLVQLADAGADLIDLHPREGLFGLEVAFVHPDSVHGVLSEVVSVG